MNLTWNPEITAGTVLTVISTIFALVGLFYGMKYSIERLHERLDLIRERIDKLEHASEGNTKTLATLAAQEERMNSFQRQIDDLRESGRMHMFEPLFASRLAAAMKENAP